MSPAPGGSGEAVTVARMRTCIVPGCHNPATGLQCDECQASREKRTGSPIAAAAGQDPHPATAAGHSGPQRAPGRIVLPWAMLVSDNQHRTPQRGKQAWQHYRDCRDAQHLEAKRQWGRAPLLTGPLALMAIVYVPNDQRRDVVNFAKATHDAMSGAVYGDDAQLVRATWERGPVDPRHPRAEITLTPISEAA